MLVQEEFVLSCLAEILSKKFGDFFCGINFSKDIDMSKVDMSKVEVFNSSYYFEFKNLYDKFSDNILYSRYLKNKLKDPIHHAVLKEMTYFILENLLKNFDTSFPFQIINFEIFNRFDSLMDKNIVHFKMFYIFVEEYI